MKVTLRFLRERFPLWNFVAERNQFGGGGWSYVGARDGVRVEVYPTSVMVGEDSFETVWRVDDGKRNETLSMWMFGAGGAA